MSVSQTERYSPADPCDICGGHESLPRGRGSRCHGFRSADGRYARCSREEVAGLLQPDAEGLYVHYLGNSCRCGQAHAPALSSPRVSEDTPARRPQILETYDYPDATGTLRYQVVRLDPKDFRQRRPKPGGGWEWNLDGVDRMPFHLPSMLAAAERGEEIWIPEGEKDVLALEGAGVVATCNSGGAGKWRDTHADALVGASLVIIVRDRDDPGHKHARDVLASVQERGIPVRLVEAAAGKDAADHLGAGLGVGDFVEVPLAPSDEAKSEEPALAWKSARELSQQEPECPDYIVEGLIAVGAITELSAKIKAGKTTFLLALIEAVIGGESFVGLPTRKTRAVYLSEERGPTFSSVLRRTGLAEAEELEVLLRNDARHLSWPEIVREAASHALEIGAELLVIDTLPDWAEVRGDQENSSGAALEAVLPLQEAAGKGLAVLVVRHDRKSGGELGDSARGSSAFGGAVDVLLSLRRANTPGHETRRELKGIGRFDETPAELVMEFENGKYLYVGDRVDAERQDARKRLSEVLPTHGEGWMAEADIIRELDASRGTVIRALEEMIGEKAVIKEPNVAGKSGRAAGYAWDEVISPRTPDHNAARDEVISPKGMNPDHNASRLGYREASDHTGADATSVDEVISPASLGDHSVPSATEGVIA